MGFDWRDFLVLARELGQAPEESKKRTAVGQAYYFVYNEALKEAKRHGYSPYVPSSAGLHKRLWG